MTNITSSLMEEEELFTTSLLTSYASREGTAAQALGVGRHGLILALHHLLVMSLWTAY